MIYQPIEPYRSDVVVLGEVFISIDPKQLEGDERLDFALAGLDYLGWAFEDYQRYKQWRGIKKG